jgi:large subunit ribosomal protein L17
MRHGKKVNHLGRTAPHRKAMLSNMAASLIKNKRIVTTVAKAKALRVYVEPLITRGKEDNTHNRRTVFSYLRDKEAIKELFGTVSEKVAARPGGYTRILKLGNRMGDNAEVAMIELVDFNEYFQGFGSEKASAKKTTRRSRSRAAKPSAKVETVVETTTETADTTENTEESNG